MRRQEKERAEIERERIRANLLRAVFHDLRTPLTTIYGSSQALIENYESLTDTQHIELLEGIREDAQRLIHMAENLLSVIRIGDTDVNLIKTSVVLEDLIDSVLFKFQKLCMQFITMQIACRISIPLLNEQKAAAKHKFHAFGQSRTDR